MPPSGLGSFGFARGGRQAGQRRAPFIKETLTVGAAAPALVSLALRRAPANALELFRSGTVLGILGD